MTPPSHEIKRVGLIGAGRIAEAHAHAIRAAGAEIAAVVCSTPQRAAEAAARLHIPVGLASVTEPNYVHGVQVAEVIASGRHFICEKPFVTDLRQAESLAHAAESEGVVGTIAFTYRYHPVAREAQARVADGELGTLISAQGGYTQDWLLTAPPTEWRLDSSTGGPSRAFADIGSHAVDLLEFVTGQRVARLVAIEASARRDAPDAAADDVAAILAQLTGGAIGSLFISQVAAGHSQSLTLELSGERAAIKLDLEERTKLWKGLAGAGVGRLMDLTDRARSTDVGHDFTPRGTIDDYFNAFTAFVRDSYTAMTTFSPSDGLPTVQDGVRSVRVGEAVRQSARSHEWVDLT